MIQRASSRLEAQSQRGEVMQYDEPVMTASLTILITYVNRFSGF